MIQKEWWSDKAYEICDLYNEEWGVGSIYARETPDGWEYAGTGWRYHSPTLEWVIKNGKKFTAEEYSRHNVTSGKKE